MRNLTVPFARPAALLLPAAALLISLGLAAYKGPTGAVGALASGGIGLYLGRKTTRLLLLGFLVFLPIAGLLEHSVDLQPVSPLLPFLFGGLTGAASRRAASIRLRISLPVGLYLASVIVAAAVSVLYLAQFFPNGNAVVMSARWGDIRLINALGWVALHGLQVMGGVGLFWLTQREIRSQNEAPMFVFILLAGFVVAVGVGLMQFLGWRALGGMSAFVADRPIPQYNASFIDPNVMASCSAIALLLCLGLVIRTPRNRALWAVGGGLIFLLVISSARSALLIVAVGFSIMLWTWGGRRKLLRAGIFAFLLLAVGLIAFHSKRWEGRHRIFTTLNHAAMFVRLSAADAFSRTGVPAERERLLNDMRWHRRKILGDRYELWRSGWVTFRHHPVFGVGLGAYLFRMPAYEKEIGGVWNDNSGNMYLHVAAERGVIGLLAFVLLLATGILAAFHSRRDPLSLGVAGALAGLAVGMVFGGHLVNAEVNFLFWFLLSLSLSRHEHHLAQSA